MSTVQVHPARRLGYADLLRTLATLAVIVIHVTALPVTAPANTLAWHALNFYDGLVRWCVPVFFMLSGMFLLDGEKALSLATLLKRNVLRVLTALLCWGAFYAAMDYRLAGGSFRSLSGLWGAVREIFFANTHFHLWFLYAIIGLYLATPVLRAFVRGAGRADFHWFFAVVFFFCSLLPAVTHFLPAPAVSNWLYYLLLDVPVQKALIYLACYVAGYYLRHYPLAPTARRVLYGLGLLGAAITVGGTAFLALRGTGDFYLYTYTTPNVLLMSAALFVLLRSLPAPAPEGRPGRVIALTSRVSFGIYLVHECFLLLLTRWGITALSFPPVLSVPILTVVVFAVSFAVSWCVNKLPIVGRYLS